MKTMSAWRVAILSRTSGASSAEPENVMRARISPASRVHSRSNASWTRRASGEGEVMTITECPPSDTARSATWRASCSSESEKEYRLAGGLSIAGSSLSARVGWRAQSLRANALAPSRVRPPTTSRAPAPSETRHASTRAAASLSVAVIATGIESLPEASAAAEKPRRTASASRPRACEAIGRMSAMCGRTAWGTTGRRVSGTGGASRSGRTIVARARTVAGSISSAGSASRPGGRVVPDSASAENAGDAIEARKRRSSALKRDIARGVGSSVTPREDGPREATMEPGLYVVATPIGNLGDVTLRALETLRRAHVIAAEDTRVTRALLHHFGIAARVVALHEHNESRAAAEVARWIAAGRAVALGTDAGTPAVSDPGAKLVQAVHAAPDRP